MLGEQQDADSARDDIESSANACVSSDVDGADGEQAESKSLVGSFKSSNDDRVSSGGGGNEDCFVDNVETKNLALDSGNPPQSGPGGDPSDDDDDDDESKKIPHDTFSMLYFAEKWWEHILPIVVFCLQMLILVLVMINLQKDSYRQLSTFLNIPANVDWTVRVSQYLACIVAVWFTDNDFVVGLRFLVKKDHIGSLENLAKWSLSNLMRTIEGTAVLLSSFLLIIQSREAIELWLNFAGVTFVGCLDNVAFELAQYHFFGASAWDLAQKVSRIRLERRIKAGRFRILGFSGNVSAILTVCSFIILTILVVEPQGGGEYSCNVVSLTVGETRYHWARYFSGAYIRSNRIENRRFVYIQNQTEGSILAYCKSARRWTVTDSGEQCENFTLMSEMTDSYDITEVNELVRCMTVETLMRR